MKHNIILKQQSIMRSANGLHLISDCLFGCFALRGEGSEGGCFRWEAETNQPINEPIGPVLFNDLQTSPIVW